jgi:hypothetical protein
MKRLATLIALICLTTAQAAWAQPRYGVQGNGGGMGRGIEERRSQRQEPRREQFDRRQQQVGRQDQRNEQRSERNEPTDRGNQRMSPDERRALREQIRDNGREIYRDPARR